MARWFGAQGPGKLSQKGAKTCPHCDVTAIKLKPKSKKVFLCLNKKTCWFLRA